MDFISTGRTNYFKVKDVDAFQKWVTSFGGDFIDKSPKAPELVGLLLNGIPDMKRADAEDDAELVEFDFYGELRDHLQKGQVAVYMESGNEGHRYVQGFAVAITPGKEDVSIATEEIYKRASVAFKIPMKRITQAVY